MPSMALLYISLLQFLFYFLLKNFLFSLHLLFFFHLLSFFFFFSHFDLHDVLLIFWINGGFFFMAVDPSFGHHLFLESKAILF